MKSLRIPSFTGRSKPVKHRYSSEKRDVSFSGKPTPLDFDSFIPWFCLELQVPKNVIVTRTNQTEYVRYDVKLLKCSTKSSKSKSRSTKSKLARSAIHSDIEEKKTSVLPKVTHVTSTVEITDAIPVTTCYDKLGRLVEIAIVGCPFEIPRKVIQAFNLCLPFHTGLSKLSIRKGGLCPIILYEISKLLPHSNITDVCLDDTRVPDGNYSILLDRSSQVKYLSLKRCSINDEECKKIATKIDFKGPALKTLLVLDLTSNNITDEGAQAFGEILKYNRYLTYLNLSGNKITDAGASLVFRYLQEFPLTYNDVLNKRRRRLDYLKSKSIAYEKCLEEVKLARFESETKKDNILSTDRVNQMINVAQQCRRKKIKKPVVSSLIVEGMTVEDEAERKTKEILGEFEDPFAEKYIKRKGDLVYCTGNLTLNALNFAYNNLTLLSVRKILNILKYQTEIKEFTSSRGLVRVVIDGNNIPNHCEELNEIDVYLKQVLWESEQSVNQLL